MPSGFETKTQQKGRGETVWILIVGNRIPFEATPSETNDHSHINHSHTCSTCSTLPSSFSEASKRDWFKFVSS
jgi:hypothetical protein